jgi:hypothetical protein
MGRQVGGKPAGNLRRRAAALLVAGACGRVAPQRRVCPIGYGERVPVVRVGAGKSKVAADLSGWPEAKEPDVGPDWPGGEGRWRLVGGFGAVAVVDGGANASAVTGLTGSASSSAPSRSRSSSPSCRKL